MPTLTRQHYRLAPRQLASRRDSYDSADIMSHRLWFSENHDEFQKDEEVPALTVGKTPLRQPSLDNLRLHSYSELLHERYMSSEEESSPSPDSDTASTVDEEDEKADVEPEAALEAKETSLEKPTEVVEPLDFEAEVAIAVPIMAIGRPKLVDITNLAPMHKRKRSAEKPILVRTATLNAAARIPAATDENMPPLSHEELTPPIEERLPKRFEQDSHTDAVPDSWLPPDEEEQSSTGNEPAGEHYFDELELRAPLTYDYYDPYSLNPPKLSPRENSSENLGASSTMKRPGSIARARKNVNANNTMLRRSNGRIGTANPSSWKGITRTLSKKQEPLRPRDAKKPKMQARGATEREETLTIPPFPFEEDPVV